jgi:cell division protein FtsN
MKSIRLTLALAVVIMATSACKTKQKIAEIPAGANIQAAAPKTSTVQTPSTYSTPASSDVKSAVNENEVTRNENFSLVDGEAGSLNYKYHVVVGSFGKQTNAKGLQGTLKSEGNKALIVVNEKGMYRVLISSYNDYKQAHARIKEISNRFPDAWVLVQK